MRIGWLLLVLSSLFACVACGGDSEAKMDASGGSERPLTVYAAASLIGVFPSIDQAARYNFAGSDELATQIREGAMADVYAAASSKHPQKLYSQGLVDKPVTFASNRLILIVPADNPARVDEVRDVVRPGMKLVIAGEGVPVGDYTREVLDNLDLHHALANITSNEDDVKGVVGKVSLGEADAGFVYATDASTAGDRVKVIELPRQSQPRIEYQIAVVKGSENREAAEAFVRKVREQHGQEALRASGFLIP